MGARRKRRTQFEYLGRHYHWWMDGGRLHVCSEDKKFVVTYVHGVLFSPPNLNVPYLEVNGHEFPGLDNTEQRPVLVFVPKFVQHQWRRSLGAFVSALIRWCMRENHKLKRIERLESLGESSSLA